MEGASIICIIYQVVHYHEDKDSEEFAQTYYEALNQTLATQVSVVASQHILWSGSSWYPIRSSTLKNKQIFSIVISKLLPVFSTVQLEVPEYLIN